MRDLPAFLILYSVPSDSGRLSALQLVHLPDCRSGSEVGSAAQAEVGLLESGQSMMSPTPTRPSEWLP